MSSYRNTRGRRRGAGADGPPESNDAVAGQRQPQSPRQQDSVGDLAGTGTANPAPRCGHLDLRLEIQGLGGGARGPAGTIEVHQPDKSVVASRLSAHAFAIPGLEALSPSPPGAKPKASKALRLAGILAGGRYSRSGKGVAALPAEQTGASCESVGSRPGGGVCGGRRARPGS